MAGYYVLAERASERSPANRPSSSQNIEVSAGPARLFARIMPSPDNSEKLV
jgi:hypothetical protein